MTSPVSGVSSRDVLRVALDQATRGLDMDGVEVAPAPTRSIAEMRRRRGRGPVSRALTLALTDVDGVLHWEEGPPPRGGPRRRRRANAVGLGGTVVREFRFEQLAPSRVVGFLSALDRKLTPHRALRRWKDGGLEVVDRPASTPRTLVFVHGTFSNSDAFFDDLGSFAAGRRFLERAESRYGQVLAFDHPTLGVSPVLNALDLERSLGDARTRLDVICHSRGGLVTFWWLQGFRGGARGVRKVVFVGSPLAGTSLAAPPRLRSVLDLLANVGSALAQVSGLASAGVPLLTAASGLMKVVASVTGLGARTPLLDAAIAMIPGLAAQSRVGNNPELLRLREAVATGSPECYAVRSNFEPSDAGWAFWKRFTRIGQEVADIGADWVFEGPNDLVVDADSMTDLGKAGAIPPRNVLDFGTSPRVHHCSYFAQPETVDFLERVLELR